MVFNQIGLKPVCSPKSYIDLVFFSLIKKPPVVWYLIIKRQIRQHFPAGKTLIGLPCNANIYTSISRKNALKANKKGKEHDCIAYIPILDVVETRDRIVSNSICNVQRHGYVGRSLYQSFAKQ